MVRDILQRAADAAGNQIKNLGPPTEQGDATFTDNVSSPSSLGAKASPGAAFSPNRPSAAPPTTIVPMMPAMQVVSSQR